jgi:hypothetical protein
MQYRSPYSLEQSWNKGGFQKIPHLCAVAALSKKIEAQNSGLLFNKEMTDSET